MKKHLIKILSIVSIAILTFFSNNLFSQVYLLNEDFSSATGVKPPTGWNSITVTGAASDVWRYDNPGQRSVTFPVIGTFAIFDSEQYSGSGGAEKVSLETPFVDCSFSPYIILYFDHVFKSNRGGKADVEIFDGTNWVVVKSFLDSVPVAKTESIDVSNLIGNKTGAKVRFTWQGDSSQYWIIDNVKLYAPLSKDARLKALNTPSMPTLAGVNPVAITLSNEGYQPITSATIRWSANGLAQSTYNWSGNIVRDSAQANIPIGTYNFPTGALTKLKIWVDNPNGSADLNKLNDTLDVNLYTALCGNYTIGGVNPNFATFNDAVIALNNAGVSCPVVFKVRDGVYAEQVKIFAIPGSSTINTVTFESESGDSSKVELHYKIGNPTNDYTLKFSGTSNVIFRKISILRSNGGQSIISDDKSSGITIERGVLNNIYVQNTRALIIRNNLLRTFGGWGVQLTSSNNVRYEDNVQECHYGLRLHGQPSDSIYIKRNTFKWVYYGYGDGAGMNFEGVVKDILEVDSNTLVQFINHGIYVNTPSGGRSKVRWNKLSDIRDYGIYMDGEGGEYIGNRILRISAGTGIVVRSRGALVANNYVQTVGLGNSKGINLQDAGSTSRILFNSVNVMGTDIVNGRALEVQGGSNYIIKNNIFANNGGGYAGYFASTPAVKDIDYNNYYSTGNSFGYLGGQLFNNLTSWGVALNSDANSKNLNPNYKADTALLPFQKQFNGAGISSGNILLDIDGELRNQQAPDIGAQEFMVDFGVTRLVSPTNDCFQKDSTPVTVYLRQFGDIPFIDLKLAYQVNNGPIFKDTIPGTISNDLEFTFKRPQNMSSNGEYLFKIWLEENGDDNLNNDTLVVLRKNKNSPRVDFSYVTQCAGIGVPFTGTAAIDTGFIARIEWDFGDSTVGVGYTPAHIYDTSGTYTVTMRAFSEQGCFSEVKKNVVLKATPIASFSVKDACFGTSVKPVNTSIAKSGGTISSYVWKWGDGKSSTGFEPTHQYSISDTFDITLIATGSNGCVDSVTNKSVTYSLENAAFKFNKPAQDFICEGSSLKLSASGASSYQWLFNKLPIDGAIDSVYQATKVGDYAVIFVNGLGCRSNPTQPLKIKFNPAPEARFNFDNYCVGSPIQFRDSSKVDSLNRVSYTWNFGDGSPAQQIGNPVYTYTKEGEYKVSLIIKSTVCANQADTVEKKLKVELPIKGKRYDPVTVLENKSKKLEAREFGVKYQWTPSLYLDNPNIAEPKYTAGKEQTYTIKITAKSGCITVDTLQVTLYDKCDIRAPEGFSPNDDGKNDKFYPFQIGIKNMQVFRVYDRFGNLVYDDKNSNSSNGWDGKHKGKKLPVGTYVWVAEGIGEDDVPVKRSGNVILIK